MKKLFMALIMLIIVFSFAGCSEVTPTVPDSSFQQGSAVAEQATQNLVNNDILPKVERSLERENIKRRIEFINQPDRIGYLYCFADNGTLVREVQVKGKVSSLNSYLTPMEQVEWYNNIDLGEYTGSVPVVVQSPDLDGTYGENAEGVFWFDANGIYQEWNGYYFYSATRLSWTTEPILMEIVK
jgi:predicted small lipoprotein YifL